MQLVTSDAHPGLEEAIAEMFVGAAWQWCRLHVLHNVEAKAPMNSQQLVAVAVRPILHTMYRRAAQEQQRQVGATLEGRFRKVVALLIAAEEETFAFSDFPPEH